MNLLTEHVLVAGAILFVIGMLGFLTRRSLILMFLSIELMLAGVSVNLVAFSRHHDNYQGQVFAILVLAVAACEAAIALALVVALYRNRATLNVNEWRTLGETVVSTPDDTTAEMPFESAPFIFPKLSPAGRDPIIDPAPMDASMDDSSFANGSRAGKPEEVSANA